MPERPTALLRRASDIAAADGDASLHAPDWRLGAALPSAHRSGRGGPRKLAAIRPASLADERKRATGILGRSKAVLARAFDDVRFGRAVQLDTFAAIAEEISASMARNPLALTGLTRLRTRHEYTYIHCVGVSAFMVGLARELDVDAALMPEIALAGLLHDMGKASVPTRLLDKPGPLSDGERHAMTTHPAKGHALLVAAGCTSELVLDVCLHHHERFDGSGYPDALFGETIGSFARLAAICDVYDAVTSTRAYKDAWTPGRALEWMAGATGHFDRRMLTAFRRLIGAFPAGTLVRLASNRLAVALEPDDAGASAPPVIVFACGLSRRPLAPQRVATTADRILTVERPSDWGLHDWDARRDALLALELS